MSYVTDATHTKTGFSGVFHFFAFVLSQDKDGSQLEIVASFLGIKIKSPIKAYPEYFV